MNEKIKLPITKDTNLGQLITQYPNVAEVLLDYGLHCVGCIAASFDSVEAGAKVHGMGDDEILELVIRLNEVVEHGE
jgi:hybrid cluster-associated redox disulfide protein